MQAARFRVSTPGIALAPHVEHALSLGLPTVPWQFRKGERRDPETLTIVANGPTARSAPLTGKTLSVNGSLKVFEDAGIPPTYWACCDPQELCADFLTWTPDETIYLVASKCHPKVFEALKGKRVFLWHLDEKETFELVREFDPVMSACSITITVFDLMYRLGYRRFETWGWDGCFMDGKAHATDQPGNTGEIIAHVGERSFASTTTWALEAQDAVMKFRLAQTRQNMSVHVHGGGMIGDFLVHHL